MISVINLNVFLMPQTLSIASIIGGSMDNQGKMTARDWATSIGSAFCILWIGAIVVQCVIGPQEVPKLPPPPDRAKVKYDARYP